MFLWIAVKFEALATAANVHHMLVFGCSSSNDTNTYRYIFNILTIIQPPCDYTLFFQMLPTFSIKIVEPGVIFSIFWTVISSQTDNIARISWLFSVSFFVNFYQRVSIPSYASAGIARAEMSVCPSVCLSVCPSHSGIVSKRRKLASWFLHHPRAWTF